MDHAITCAAAGATPSTTPPAAAAPRSWMLCLTSANHGTVGPLGSTFPHAGEKHERVQVMEIVEAGTPPAPGADLAGLVRFDLSGADAAQPVGEFQGYVDGEPFVAWADRTRMPQVGDKLYAGAAPVAAQAGQVAVSEAVRILREAIERQLAPDWNCNSDHPALAAALKATEYLALPAVAQQAPAQAEPFDFHAHLARQAAWSEKTFGAGPRTKGVCDHIRKELMEIEADPLDLREWIDVVILGLDGAWRCGGTPYQIIAGIVAKQSKNEGRTWPDWRTADPDKAIEHDRSKDGAQASTSGERQKGGAA